MQSEKKYMTVLIEYTTESNDFPAELTKAFADNGEIKGSNIVAVSLEDEFSRLESLESELDLINDY